MRGITTWQIKSAPHDAYYVCHSSHMLRALRKMAQEHKRSDLHVMTVDELHKRSHGTTIEHVVIDHAVYDSLNVADTNKLHETLANIYQHAEVRRRYKHPRGPRGVIKNVVDFIRLACVLTFTKNIHARCEFSRRFFDVHDYSYWKGGDGNPSHFHTYRCWNCGKKFRI